MRFDAQQSRMLKIGLFLMFIVNALAVLLAVVPQRTIDLQWQAMFFMMVTPFMLGLGLILFMVLRKFHRPRTLSVLSSEQLRGRFNSPSWIVRLGGGAMQWYLHVDENGIDRDAEKS